MFQYHLVIFISITFYLAAIKSEGIFDKNPIVNTRTGRVRGSVLKTRYDEEFYAFRGIRYGKPPINELRFQAPQPIEYWDEIFDATDDGPACVQTSNFKQSEDCLRLNIYSKNLPDNSTKSNMQPVLFQIHGGALLIGSGLSVDLGSPIYLMERDIVFVSINYRLGVFGFLSLNISQAPGNAGFKDQVLALKWVKNNIDRFGGDPNKITLVGDSAGGYSVLLHVVSPMSQNLFKRVIMMSPVMFSHRITSNLLDISKELAIDVGCTSPFAPEQIYDCLFVTDSAWILEFYPSRDIPPHKTMIWDAVAEPDFGQERFLVEDPYVSFKNQRFAKVALLIGVDDKELFEYAHKIVNNETAVKLFPYQFHDILPICFLCEKISDYPKKVGSAILNSYNLSVVLRMDDFPKLGELVSDGLIVYPVQRVIDFWHKSADVFYYELSFHQRESVFMVNEKPYGVAHGDEDGYIFNRQRMFGVNDPENKIVEQLTRMWVQFVLTGTPNTVGDPCIKNFTWQPYTNEDHYYLKFGDELVMGKDLNRDRLSVWYKYFE